MMRRVTVLVAIAFAPWACVIDGVPLPDQTDDARNNEEVDMPAGFASGVGLFATRASGVTLVFGLPATVDGGATIVASSGTSQARTTADDDGSFNVALIGELTTTINVAVVVAGRQTISAAIDTPVASNILVPDGTAVAGDDPPEFAAASTTRVDAANANVVFPAGSFGGGVIVAVANLDRGSTSTGVAAQDGSLAVAVKADSGDTLYVVALADTGASSPYIITAP
ncbi:MAG: hypothetical protein ACAI38_20215 [Myxococcota bacterium]|nr:hypothetical protein [Myxococcota bacterium]